jgi:uncharacterized membrane protein
MEQTEQRIERLERLVADLDGRIGLLEQPGSAAGPQLERHSARTALADRAAMAGPTARPASPRPTAERPAPAASAPTASAASPRPTPPPRSTILDLNFGREDLEDLVGGRVLAWVGGLAVMLGIVFLFALAISNGWIGETPRVALGAAGSAGLLVLGVWLHKSKARTDAALASVATGISGLFITITVAAQVYEVVPQLIAVLFAIATGGIATALAVRWESRGIGSLGILGALGAPVLTGVAGDGGTMLILFVALASAAGVLLWQRWNWLALAAFAVATPQWAGFVLDNPPVIEKLAVLVGFGLLGVVVSIGHDLRVRAERLRSSSAYLLILSAIVVAGIGWVALSSSAGEGAGNAWLAGVALVHLGVGLSGRFLRLTDDVRLLALVIGAVLADVAFGLIAHGPVHAIGWAATGIAFAALIRRPRPVDADVLAQAGLGGHLALSMLSAIAVSNPVQVLNGAEPLSAAGAGAVGALAAGCLVSARVAGERHETWRAALDSMGLVAIAVLTALTLDGLQLVLAWALEVVALGAIARRTRDSVAWLGALGFLACAALHTLIFEAPPVSLVTGLAEPAAAVAALASIAGCLVLLAGWAEFEEPEVRTALRGLAAVTLLYLASTGVVTPFESDSAVDSALLSAHQQGQMVLSVFWGVVGVSTVVVGLRRDLGIVRVAGLALLGVAVGKVFLFDLATLTSVYRVVSFIGIGLLLLGGALTWQRLRPRALSDLRETPAGVR